MPLKRPIAEVLTEALEKRLGLDTLIARKYGWPTQKVTLMAKGILPVGHPITQDGLRDFIKEQTGIE